MPIRSAGCATCRKRKIRCDETRPFCKRCAVHGVACPGYRTEQPGGLEFRDITAQVAKKATQNQRADASSSKVNNDVAGGKPFSAAWNGVLKSASSSVDQTAFLGHDENDEFHLDSVNNTVNLIRTNSVSSSSSGSSSDSNSSDAADRALAMSTALPPWFNRLFPALLTQIPHPGAMAVGNSAHINLSQVYSAFLNLWLPEEYGYTDHAILWGHVLKSSNGNRTLRQSLRAISCIAVGDKYQDIQLLREGMISYGSALTSLASSIAKKNFFPEDGLLAAVTVLATCEFYTPLAREGSGWLKHIKGASHLMTSRGPETIHSTLGLMVYSNARHPNLAQAIIARQACFMSKPEWRALAFRCPVIDASTYFYDLAMFVPGLLERHDALLKNHNRSAEEVEGLLQECIDVDIGLSDWFDSWRPAGNKDDQQPILTVEPIEKFQNFASLVKSRVITTGFRFQTYPSGYLAAIYWCTLHSLRGVMQSLYNMYRALDPIGLFGEENLAPSDEELAQYAMNLAQCIPYFCEPGTSTMGHVGIFLPMYIMAQQFRKMNDFPKLLWLREAQSCIFNRGIMPPNVHDHEQRLVSSV